MLYVKMAPSEGGSVAPLPPQSPSPPGFRTPRNCQPGAGNPLLQDKRPPQSGRNTESGVEPEDPGGSVETALEMESVVPSPRCIPAHHPYKMKDPLTSQPEGQMWIGSYKGTGMPGSVFSSLCPLSTGDVSRLGAFSGIKSTGQMAGPGTGFFFFGGGRMHACCSPLLCA